MQILEHILKIRREKAKQKFSQTVGNQLATIWHCEMWFANFALRNSPTTKHCSFVSHKNAKPLRKFALPNLHPNSQPVSHCEIRCGFSHCEISHCEIRCGFSHCEIRNTLRTVCELIAKNSHCFALRFCFAHNFFIRTPF